MPYTLEEFRGANAYEEIEGLHGLGFNYEYEVNPWLTFLDLIGYSQEQFGQNFQPSTPELDFVALDFLADALKEYSKYPHEATLFINLLIKEETN